jgi:DNA-binding Lrp family transcriptional regulator
MAERLDAADKKILNMLQKDARVPFSRISAEAGSRTGVTHKSSYF